MGTVYFAKGLDGTEYMSSAPILLTHEGFDFFGSTLVVAKGTIERVVGIKPEKHTVHSIEDHKMTDDEAWVVHRAASNPAGRPAPDIQKIASISEELAQVIEESLLKRPIMPENGQPFTSRDDIVLDLWLTRDPDGTVWCFQDMPIKDEHFGFHYSAVSQAIQLRDSLFTQPITKENSPIRVQMKYATHGTI